MFQLYQGGSSNVVTGTIPRLQFLETGAAVNEGLWDIIVNSTVDGGFLSLRALNDDGSLGQTVFEVQRNGSVVKHWAMGNTVANDPGDGVVRPYFRVRHAWPAITSGTGDTYRLISGRGEVTIVPAAGDDFSTGMFTLHITPTEPASYNAATTFAALTTEVASTFSNNASVIPFVAGHISDVTLGPGNAAGGAYTTVVGFDVRMLGGIKAGASIANLRGGYILLNHGSSSGGTVTEAVGLLIDTPDRGAETWTANYGLKINSQNPGGGGVSPWNLYSVGDNPSRIEGILELGLAGLANARLKFNGATSGVITVKSASVAGTYTWTWPTAVTGAGSRLITDGAGITSFAAPLTAASSPADPVGTTSTTGVMMGLAGAITPVTSGKVLITVSGMMANNTVNDGVGVQLRYGTGTAPANAAALTGTTLGVYKNFTSLTAALKSGFALSFVVSGLTLTTAIWIDCAVKAITGGTATITDVDIVAEEL